MFTEYVALQERKGPTSQTPTNQRQVLIYAKVTNSCDYECCEINKL